MHKYAGLNIRNFWTPKRRIWNENKRDE